MTHREHVSKEEAQAFVERIVQLEAELAQAVTRAEAAEQEARELRLAHASVLETAWEKAFGRKRKLALFHVKDDEVPMFVIARDFNRALLAWTKKMRAENDPIDGEWQPLGIDFVASSEELMLAPDDLDQVVR